MTDEKKEKLGFSPEGWQQFLKDIAETFGCGKLISHEWLKNQFGLKELMLIDYESVDEFLRARDNQQFAYMTIVDAVRWDLLEQENMFLINVRGDGYRILQPNEQIPYAYNQFWEDLRKTLRVTEKVMTYALPVDLWQQSKDNDLRAKFAMMKQMIESARK